MRQIVRKPYHHGVHVQILENDSLLVEDIFPSKDSAQLYSVGNFNALLTGKNKKPLSEEEINILKDLVSQ